MVLLRNDCGNPFPRLRFSGKNESRKSIHVQKNVRSEKRATGTVRHADPALEPLESLTRLSGSQVFRQIRSAQHQTKNQTRPDPTQTRLRRRASCISIQQYPMCTSNDQTILAPRPFMAPRPLPLYHSRYAQRPNTGLSARHTKHAEFHRTHLNFS